MRTPAIYGAAPKILGVYTPDVSEMMYWLYCPIKMPYGTCFVPPNLQIFNPILAAVNADCQDKWQQSYVYITAKTLWVNGSTANRPGWHSDGFLTDDLNYIWMTSAPTIFCVDSQLTDFVADHNKSLAEMEKWAEERPHLHKTYPTHHLLRLDQGVIHKVDTNMKPGIRTFLKISVSEHVYALRGNSINHELPLIVKYSERQELRNCPTGATSKKSKI